MIVFVPRETHPGERRVALTPDVAKRVVGGGVDVWVEAGAGSGAAFADGEYAEAGARVDADRVALFARADVVLMVQRPRMQDPDEVALLREGAVLIGMLYPLTNLPLVRRLVERRVTSFSLDQLPRVTRAQPMDALSSQATVAGYKAVLLAAAQLGRFFPMLVTAAGTIAPARVLVLGAGVAGLQAIATARRLGAVVEAFDVRPAVKEQVESLGAKFLMAEAVAAEGEGGYATELSEEQHRRELALIHERIRQVDVVVTTALIPGRPAPVLITEEMVRDMRAGSVIVDLAAEMGGNCALTEAGRTVERHGVAILGPTNLPATMPVHASQMYARNLLSFLGGIVRKGALDPDFGDEIVAATCITRDGQVVHERTRQALGGIGS